MTEAAKEFDVAISFCARDEELARQLGNMLAPLNVFVYSKEQEEVAGTDGTESFRGVFRERSRVVVVLHRELWGHTRWTRVEELAVQDYMLETRFHPLVFVQLDKSAPPKWLPETHIRFDLETYSVAELVGAIKASVARHGGVLKPQSAVDKARALSAQEAFDRETRELLDRGPEPFSEASAVLFAVLRERVEAIHTNSGWKVFQGPTPAARDYMVCIAPASLQLLPEELYVNTARDAFYRVRFFNGRFILAEEARNGRYMTQEPKPQGEHRLNLKRTRSLGWCWEYQHRVGTADETADALLTALLELRSRLARQ